MKNSVRSKCLMVVLAMMMTVAIPTSIALAQVTMNVNYIQLDQLNIGDLDFQTGGSRSWFFTVNVSGESRSVFLRMRVTIQLPDATFPDAIGFSDAEPWIDTEPFQVPRTFTNLDLGQGSTIKIKAGKSIRFDETAKTRIQNEALATGKLPSGVYTFSLSIRDPAADTTLDSDQIVLNILNISRLDLISPRDNEEVPNTFPLFQWIFDGTRVELSIYERLPQHQSKEEAAQGTPHLCVLLENVRSFQYPSATPPNACPGVGMRPLEAGHNYVWKVRGFTSGSGGVGNIINSEIWQFTVSAGGAQRFSLTGGGGTGSQQQNIFNQLQNIPGIPSQVLNQLLGGNFQLTGVILVNGVPVSPTELLAVLNDLAQNPDKIIEVQIIDRP